MRRIKLTVAYDGTAYRGWQLQKNGETIEGVLNRELSALLREEIEVIGASRTDSGVHALGNVAVFDTESRIPGDKFALALNQKLPPDVRVVESEEVPPAFHPRKANCRKTYEYRILNRRTEDPTRRLYSHFYHYALDLGQMREAAGYLLGEHDFVSFCSVNSSAENTVRTIYSLDITRENDMITIRICGSGFLYNMVRIIAGTLIEIGSGKYPPSRMEEVLEARDRAAAGDTAPARGLTLISMEYEKEPVPVLRGENRHYRYELDQRELCAAFAGRELPDAAGITSRLTVLSAEDAEFPDLVGRMVHAAFRNGADRVLVRDAEKARIAEGMRFGFYVIGGTGGGTGVGSPFQAENGTENRPPFHPFHEAFFSPAR